jgi:hypothetical protein
LTTIPAHQGRREFDAALVEQLDMLPETRGRPAGSPTRKRRATCRRFPSGGPPPRKEKCGGTALVASGCESASVPNADLRDNLLIFLA